MAWNASRAAVWISDGSSSGYRVTGTGPRSPCHASSPNSASASRRRNAGRTSSKLQPGFPRAAQASKSAAAPRTAKRVSHEVPPRSRPRRSLLVAPSSSASDSNCQSGNVGSRHPSRQSGGIPSLTSGPASRRTTDRSPAAARRLATTQPAAPPPTTAMSYVSRGTARIVPPCEQLCQVVRWSRPGAEPLSDR